ncbi:MAG: hypothetical protein EP330_24490 [Deltaproteobacteria bacterium]|nr:MAG: hypothetical protein EP330_24490 [Deltaproteobacteria bacterium]
MSTPHDRALSCLAAGDLPENEAEAVRKVLAEDPALAARSEALAQVRTEVADALFLRAPRGLLDLVEAPEPSLVHPRPGRRRWATLALVILALGTALTFWLRRSVDLGPELEVHRRVEAPGTWIAPDDGPALTAAWEHNRVPSALRVVPDLAYLGLSPMGVLVVPGKPSGTVVFYEDASGSPLSWQLRDGDLPELGEHSAVHGVRVHHGAQGELAVAAYATNGVVHVIAGRRAQSELLDLVERRLAARP